MCPFQLQKVPLLSIKRNPYSLHSDVPLVLHIEESLCSPFCYTPNFKAGFKDKSHWHFHPLLVHARTTCRRNCIVQCQAAPCEVRVHCAVSGRTMWSRGALGSVRLHHVKCLVEVLLYSHLLIWAAHLSTYLVTSFVCRWEFLPHPVPQQFSPK